MFQVISILQMYKKNINKVVINFTSRRVTLSRIGATHTHHSTVRDAFEFSFTN